VFRNQLGALALAAAFMLPLAATAQTVPPPGAAAPPAAQQGQQRPNHRRHRRSPYLHAMRGLHLSDAQRQQIAGILKSSRAASKGADAQTRRANMQAMRRQIDGILTPDQRTQLQAKVAQARRHFAQPNGPARQAPPQ
jgi:Spy/CpxP family protein refolding chaperone